MSVTRLRAGSTTLLRSCRAALLYMFVRTGREPSITNAAMRTAIAGRGAVGGGSRGFATGASLTGCMNVSIERSPFLAIRNDGSRVLIRGLRLQKLSLRCEALCVSVVNQSVAGVAQVAQRAAFTSVAGETFTNNAP